MDDSVLWVLTYFIYWEGKRLRHTKFFHTEDAALVHRDWINDGRGKVISLKKYKVAEIRYEAKREEVE